MAKDKVLDRENATIRNVADHFGVTDRTVYRWLSTTDIPHRRIRNTIRFNLAEVDEWSSRGGRNGDTDGSE